MNLHPAVLIGGPPHAGKSAMAYSLAQALKLRKRALYLLRAAPDGEGDWAQQADPEIVQDIRFKGRWTPHWVDVTVRDLANRPLPMLVDVGGRPTPAQEAIFDQCTGAILLTRTDDERAEWLARIEAHGLRLIADLHSDLNGADYLEAVAPVIRGTQAGPKRGGNTAGAVFDALVDHLVDLFQASPEQRYATCLAQAPFSAQPAGCAVQPVNLEQIAYQLHGNDRFAREDIPAVLKWLPREGSLALYGRAPVWLYAAVARRRDIAWQFDVRLGWVNPPSMAIASAVEAVPDGPVTFRVAAGPLGFTTLTTHIDAYYLDYEDIARIRPPYLPPEKRLLLYGRLPFWLTARLAQAYRTCAFVDAPQPQEYEQLAAAPAGQPHPRWLALALSSQGLAM